MTYAENDIFNDIFFAPNPEARERRIAQIAAGVPRILTNPEHSEQTRRAAYSAAGVNQAITGVDVSLTALRKSLREVTAQVAGLDLAVGRMTNGLHAPGNELADAKAKIEEQKKRIAGLIKEARRQSARADRAEERAKITPAEIEASKPGDVAFLRRTPGDAIRYLASVVMVQAEADVNAELMGAVMGLRMVADDVDRLPQG
ncbi:hypothetical protein ACH4S8_37495 [Streptomyces sp. NPDC021080]|uniref:hypothetical protein n=1 Tax=Streptomyces sp. NPDC021080 TaxID=3365110 RepID=UPI00379926AD